MQETGKKEKRQARPTSLDAVDVIFWAGLVCLLVGLGLTVGWGWGLAAAGSVLTGLGIFLASPPKHKEGK
jgi:hypothetical protein